MTPSDNVKPEASSLIVNKTFAANGSPLRNCRALPLSLAIEPVMTKDSPAIGFAVIGSTTITVVERIVTVERFLWVESKSKLPLYSIEIVIKPSGWSNGTV